MATVAAENRTRRRRPEWDARIAVARRTLRDSRVRTVAFGYLFAAVAFIQPISYRHTYPTIADRIAFAHAFAHNKAVVLFYGKAYDLLTVGGYSAWRVGGILSLFAAVFGLLAAVRATRTEEDTGRAELVIAGIVGRRPAFWAAMAAIALETALLVDRGPRRFGRRRACARRLGVPCARRGIDRSRVRRRGRTHQPARSDAQDGDRARGCGSGDCLPAARDRRYGQRGRVAAMGNTARVGRGASAVHRRASRGARALLCRQRRARGCGRSDLARARHRQWRTRSQGHGRAAAPAADNANPPSASRRADQPARRGSRASACLRSSSA